MSPGRHRYGTAANRLFAFGAMATFGGLVFTGGEVLAIERIRRTLREGE